LESSVGGALSEPGTEIELEFDREVYPIGVSIAASIVGVTQRMLRSAAAVQVRLALMWMLMLLLSTQCATGGTLLLPRSAG
jgi:hypothetical protein